MPFLPSVEDQIGELVSSILEQFPGSTVSILEHLAKCSANTATKMRNGPKEFPRRGQAFRDDCNRRAKIWNAVAYRVNQCAADVENILESN